MNGQRTCQLINKVLIIRGHGNYGSGFNKNGYPVNGRMIIYDLLPLISGFIRKSQSIPLQANKYPGKKLYHSREVL